ncbi:MAG: four-carbon acid sugar kinase family protein [Spirochaetaceae bacterium]|nr:MAG: four-carbon acid sugar kinase family protein [Spirochaetaceae bacterium]
MIRCCIIADDLTGANATGVLLGKLGLHSCTVLKPERLSDEHRSHYDVVTIPTDSRGLPAPEAYRRVHDAVSCLSCDEIQIYNKRIDSTLRGNVGSEIDAMLDALPDTRIAVVVPVFPQAGRIAVGGYLLVNGVLLERTDAAKDPKMPVRTSRVRSIIEAQTKYPVHTIDLETVYQGETAVTGALERIGGDTNAIVVFDAITDADLDVIARAVLKSGIPFISADPGPFTAAVARQLLFDQTNTTVRPQVLMCVGSVTSLTVEQLRHSFEHMDVSAAFLHAEEVIDDEARRNREIDRVTAILRDQASRVLCISSNHLDISRTLDLEQQAKERNTTAEALSTLINRSLAGVAERLLDSVPSLGGVYASGGDITVALCEASGAEGVAVMREIIPLAAEGTLIGGTHDGLRIVSKGGMVGGTDAATVCIRSILERLDALP